MMRRFPIFVFWLLLVLPGLVQAQKQDVKLRSWCLGLQSVTAWYDTHDVFGKDILPESLIDEYGQGLQFHLGRRLGERFILGGQIVGSLFEVPDGDEDIVRVELEITGTVLFRERDTLQPFLRGGVGLGLEALRLDADAGEVLSYGSSALFSGGLQVRISSRFGLEFEAASTYVNFLEVNDNTTDDLGPDGSWRVRDSSWGWRLGVGVTLWL